MVNPVLTILMQFTLIASAAIILGVMIREGRSARRASVGRTSTAEIPYERHIVLLVRTPRRATVGTRRPAARQTSARRGAA